MTDQTPRLFALDRLDFCALLTGLIAEEWQAATLCAGWTVEDVVAHMVVRERDPLALVRAALSGGLRSASHTALIAREKERGPAALLAMLRTMPPLFFRLPGVVAQYNLSEAYIHNEDVRRGALNRPRQTSADLQQALWDALPITMRLLRMGHGWRQMSVAGILAIEWPGRNPRVLYVGRHRGVARRAKAVVTGEPGELLLWLSGRKQAAAVHLDGDAAFVAALCADVAGP